ncbi:MAG: hypothetical protein QME68_00155 [Elusimicrobiota bacterium]|nr:hypothetical protein [Elusimicrobiota bacterium]
MFFNRFRDIFLIIFFVLCYYTLFVSKDIQTKYKPIKGVIYDIEKSTGDTVYTTSKERVLIENDKMPTLTVYSELFLPDKFIAEKTQSKTAADYIVVSEKLLEKKFIFKTEVPVKIPEKEVKGQEKKKPAQIRKIEQKKKKPEREDIKQEEKSLIFNFHTLQNLVEKIEKTYFYPNLKIQHSNIELRIISFTPYKDKGILKLSLSNNSKQYFFIATVGVSKKDTKIPADFFGAQFVAPDSSQILYLLIREMTVKKDLVLSLIESGGKERWLKIKFSLP